MNKKSFSNPKVNINYLQSSAKMKEQVKDEMQIPRGKREESLMQHMTSQHFVNRDKSQLRDQLKTESENMWKTNIKHKKVDIQPIGHVRRDLEHAMICSNFQRKEEIEHNQMVVTEKNNLEIPQEQLNKKLDFFNKADIVLTPYDPKKYTRIGNLIQRQQDITENSSRLLMTQPFSRQYLKNRRLGMNDEEALSTAINEEIENKKKAEHSMFNPFIDFGVQNVDDDKQINEKEITQKINPNGSNGKVISNINKFDMQKLHNIIQMLGPSSGIHKGHASGNVMSDLSGVSA